MYVLLTSCGVNCVCSWPFSHRSCRVTMTPTNWNCRQKTYQRRRHWWRKTATIRSVSSRLWLVADPDPVGSLSLRLAAEFSQYALAIANCHLLANSPTNLAMPFAKRRWLANIPPPALVLNTIHIHPAVSVSPATLVSQLLSFLSPVLKMS